MKASTATLFILLPVALIALADESRDASEIEKAEKIVGEQLKDPSSAQFRDVVYVSDTHAVCGKYNGKNSYGAYVGFSDFAVDEQGKVYTISSASAGDTYAELKAKLAEIKRFEILCPKSGR